MKALVLSIVLALSWLQAGTLAPRSKPRPKPIETDRPQNGPFHAPIVLPAPDVWRPDASGLYWVKNDNGTFYYGRTQEQVKPYGKPVDGGSSDR